MDNPHMFDELTNRLNKVKRPDSGIHNSGEFIGDNEKLDKSEEQADSGRDSDPAEPGDSGDGSGAVKKGGLLKSFKKMFKIRRKSKGGKIKDDDKGVDDDKVISTQYRAVSEPDIINSGSSKESAIPRSNTAGMPKRYNDPNVIVFISDDEETRIDEKKSSLKDAPSFIRSSLRKLKLKKKKTGGMDSTEVTPTSVKKHGAPPPVSPKKSPKKPRSSSRSSHSSDQTEARSDSFNKDFNNDTDDYLSGKSSRTDSLNSQPIAVNIKDDLQAYQQAYQPVIESSAAKDKIRVAPRGRKRPTRKHAPSKGSDISERKSSLAQISEDDISDGVSPVGSSPDDIKDTLIAELTKKPKDPVENKLDINKKKVDNVLVNGSSSIAVNGVQQHKVNEVKIIKNNEAVNKAFDSVISSLESIKTTSDVPAPKKSSPELKKNVLADINPPLTRASPLTSNKPVSKTTSRENIRASPLTSDKPVSKTTSRENIKAPPLTSGKPVSKTTSRENIKAPPLTSDKPVSKTTSRENIKAPPLTSDKPVSKTTSRENIEQTHYNTRRNTDSVTNFRKSIENTKDSLENLENAPQSLKNSVSLGDLIIDSKDDSPKRRSRSFKNFNETEDNSGPSELPNEIELLKDDSTEQKRYDKYRKGRSQTSPENRSNVRQNNFSKSVEDVSVLNKENNRRSGHFIEPLGTIHDVNRSNLLNDTRLPINDENIRKSKEQLEHSSSRHSLNETTFAITSSKNQDPYIPYGNHITDGLSSTSPDKPRKLQRRLVSGSKEDVNKSTSRKPRPQSVTVRSTDASVIFGIVSGARSYGDIRSINDLPDLEKSTHVPPTSKKQKPHVNTEPIKTIEKPLLVSTGKSKSFDVQPVSDNLTNGNEPEFKRMSLRKTPKAEDYLPREIVEVLVASEVEREENPVLASVKTTLKHVEPKVDTTKPEASDEKVEVCAEQSSNVEFKTNANKEKHLPSPVTPESKHFPVEVTNSVETREIKDKAPEFHRISLKKVEKRDDYLEKESESISPKEEHGDLDQTSVKSENKRNSSEIIGSSYEVTTNLPSPNNNDDIPEKPKPPIKAKPFQFQSHDVKHNDNSKTQSSFDKPKAVPLSQTAKLPYFRKSIDIQENPNPHGSVPAWIAMARERQRDEATEKVAEEVPKQTTEKSEDVTEESLVKPSAFKPKPAPLPKPSVPVKPDTSPQSTSPPVGKKPPPVSQRPSLGRFNAKTDLPKDACMVCGKTVYVLERCEVNNRTLHRSCAKCYICSRTLNVGDIFINEGKVWCKQHR